MLEEAVDHQDKQLTIIVHSSSSLTIPSIDLFTVKEIQTILFNIG